MNNRDFIKQEKAPLDVPLSKVFSAKSVVKKLEKLGINTVEDLLWNPPRRLHHWGELTSFARIVPGSEVTLFAVVTRVELSRTRAGDKAMLSVQISDESSDRARGFLTVRFFARNSGQLSAHERRLQVGQLAVFAGKVSGTGSNGYLAHPEYQVIEDFDLDSAQAFASQPQAVYSATAGLPSWKIGKIIRTQLSLTSEEQIPEVIPVSLRQQWDLPSAWEALHLLHFPQEDADLERALRYLRYEEALLLQLSLLQIRQQWRELPAPSLPKRPGGLRDRLLDALPFSLTDGQKKALEQIDADLALSEPMGRLLQGDVGSGKTVVAALAAATCLDNDYQVAFLAPTEVLARQHFETFERFFPAGQGLFSAGLTSGVAFSPRIELLTSSTPLAKKRQILADLAAGVGMLVVGTQALLSENALPSRLGLLIVDEQHRFGVYQREKLRSFGDHHAHQLVMTATPIPRTVAMSVFGSLEISRIEGLPQGRKGVKTILVPADNSNWVKRMWQRAREEIDAGGRVFVVCPRISPEQSEASFEVEDLFEAQEVNESVANVEQVYEFLSTEPALSGVSLGKAHSALPRDQKNQQVADFAAGKTSLLVCTTVIEVGMDIPQATMMIILDAQRFGLSQLHQLRGRVGRGNLPGLCLAVFAPVSSVDQKSLSVKNMTAMRLGAFAKYLDGFELANADLQIRKEGDVLGMNQSGGVSSLRFLSLFAHEEIILQARQGAREILQSDPELVNHTGLAVALAARLDKERQSHLNMS